MCIAAYTSVCEEDTEWIDGYLKEAERLIIPFAIHLDRVSGATKRRLIEHHLCIGYTEQTNPLIEFNELHKQGVFDIVWRAGFTWAMGWDVDEVYAPNTFELLPRLLESKADYVDIKWVNFWGDEDHIRVDGPFSEGHRQKFYRLDGGMVWRFYDPTVNGPKGVWCDSRLRARKPVEFRFHELVCLHKGLMTRRLRELHKARWDRIYRKAIGRNPYKIWNHALDEDKYPPVVIPNPYRV